MATLLSLGHGSGLNVDLIVSWRDDYDPIVPLDRQEKTALIPCLTVHFAAPTSISPQGAPTYSQAFYGAERLALLAYFAAQSEPAQGASDDQEIWRNTTRIAWEFLREHSTL